MGSRVLFFVGILVFCDNSNYSISMSRSAKVFSGISVIILLILASYVFVFDQTVFGFKNKDIVVQGETWHKIVLEQYRKKWQVRFLPYQNKNLWQVPLSRLRSEAAEDISVQDVVMERVWPSGIRVEITLKPIVMVFLESKKSVLPVTADGQILEPMDLDLAPDVPILRNRQILHQPESLRKMLDLYAMLPREGVISKAEVAEVDWSAEQGLIVEMSRMESGAIVLGATEVELKSKRVANVLKYLESQNQKWRVIDASFAKKVLVRLRKHS